MAYLTADKRVRYANNALRSEAAFRRPQVVCLSPALADKPCAVLTR